MASSVKNALGVHIAWEWGQREANGVEFEALVDFFFVTPLDSRLEKT